MPTKKKSTKQPVPAFAPGARVYVHHFDGRQGSILQAQVKTSDVKRRAITSEETGKIIGSDFIVVYELETSKGVFFRPEFELVSSFTDIAKGFAKQFLTLLK